MARSEDEPFESSEAHPDLGKVVVSFPLRPSEFNIAGGEITSIKKRNDFIKFLSGVHSKNEKERKIAEWFQTIGKDTETGKRKGQFVATVTGVTFLIGAATFKFGVRHGKDIGPLWQGVKAFKRHERKKRKKA